MGRLLSMRPEEFRNLMAKIPFPVGILSTKNDETRQVISSTVSSFASADSTAKMNVISFNLKKNSYMSTLLKIDQKISINFLSESQEPIAKNYSKFNSQKDLINLINIETEGQVFIDGAYASIFGSIHSFYELESSKVFITKVIKAEQKTLSNKPLIYMGRKYLTI